MTDSLTITRTVDVDLDRAELWALIGTTVGWEQWLIESADDAALLPGASLQVIDHDGVRRSVTVTEVDAGRSISFRWHDVGEAADSAVTLAINESTDGCPQILITETRSTAQPSVRAQFGWSLPIMLLGLAGILAAVPVR